MLLDNREIYFTRQQEITDGDVILQDRLCPWCIVDNNCLACMYGKRHGICSAYFTTQLGNSLANSTIDSWSAMTIRIDNAIVDHSPVPLPVRSDFIALRAILSGNHRTKQGD